MNYAPFVMNTLDDPERWRELDPVQRRIVLFWIERHISPRSRINKLAHAFKLKNILLHDTGLFISTGAFKGAMIEVGYFPIEPSDSNPYYRINLH